jgi:hypothetical protein
MVWSQSEGEGILIIDGITENPLSGATFDTAMDAGDRNDFVHEVYEFTLANPRAQPGAEGEEVPYMEAGGDPCPSCQNKSTCCACYCNADCGKWGDGCWGLVCTLMCAAM